MTANNLYVQALCVLVVGTCGLIDHKDTESKIVDQKRWVDVNVCHTVELMIHVLLSLSHSLFRLWKSA